jgi:hypothetical protein
MKSDRNIINKDKRKSKYNLFITDKNYKGKIFLVNRKVKTQQGQVHGVCGTKI